ncbi:hypothetical protein SGL43_02948 [Streptomyces globisporus]|uniref:Uncharacterized protein n=1 Tax=Streptomyces globisporus TaxID=1908 RepID=A0ABM9GX46_STRGL|nr:hypothetical protein SGL43_02948 [Streptomyces globisporus]
MQTRTDAPPRTANGAPGRQHRRATAGAVAGPLHPPPPQRR